MRSFFLKFELKTSGNLMGKGVKVCEKFLWVWEGPQVLSVIWIIKTTTFIGFTSNRAIMACNSGFGVLVSVYELVLKYLTLPYSTLPYSNLPYPVLPCPALSCPTLPYGLTRKASGPSLTGAG